MNDKVALLTGSAKRVGACIARTLHESGMRVIIHYRNSRDAAESLVDELNAKRKDSAVCLQADLNDIADIETLGLAAIKTWGRLDALINNASAFYPTPIGEVTNKDWDTLFSSNAKAPFFLSQTVASALKASGGSIVNMVDIHADRPLKDHSIYCMAKAALGALTRTLARDLAPDVRVNGIAPGMIMWPDGDNEMDEKTKKYILSRVPLQKAGEPQYVANAILFLLQQEYITGQIIAVDGGRSLNV